MIVNESNYEGENSRVVRDTNPVNENEAQYSIEEYDTGVHEPELEGGDTTTAAATTTTAPIATETGRAHSSDLTENNVTIIIVLSIIAGIIAIIAIVAFAALNQFKSGSYRVSNQGDCMAGLRHRLHKNKGST